MKGSFLHWNIICCDPVLVNNGAQKKFHSSHDEWNSTINFYNLMYMMCIWLNIEVLILFACFENYYTPNLFIPLTRCKCRIIPHTVQMFLWKKSTEIDLLLLFNFSVINKISSILMAWRRLDAFLLLAFDDFTIPRFWEIDGLGG